MTALLNAKKSGLPIRQRKITDMQETMEYKDSRKRNRDFRQSDGSPTTSLSPDMSTASPQPKKGATNQTVEGVNEDPLKKGLRAEIGGKGDSGENLAGSKSNSPVLGLSQEIVDAVFGKLAQRFDLFENKLSMQIEGLRVGAIQPLAKKVSELTQAQTQFSDEIQHIQVASARQNSAQNAINHKVQVQLGEAKNESESVYAKVRVANDILKNRMNVLENIEFVTLRLEARQKASNMYIDGIRESPNQESYEVMSGLVLNFCQNIMGLTGLAIAETYRIGARPRRDGTPRSIFVQFRSPKDCERVWSAKKKLNENMENKKYRIRLDIPKKLQAWNQMLLFIAFNARKNTEIYGQVSVRDFILYLNRIPYFPYDLLTLPEALLPTSLYSPCDDKVLVFFTSNSIYSNHYISTFEVEGQLYSCIEQFLAVARARQAKNEELERKALNTEDPVICKGILYALRSPRTNDTWYADAPNILHEGLTAKFSQCPDLRNALVGSHPRLLGEASTNRYWGIGLTLYSEDRLNPQHWKGKNVLGKALERVRNDLKDIPHNMEVNRDSDDE